MGLGLGISLGLGGISLGEGGVPSWVDRDNIGSPALLTLDAANDRGWFSGASYPTEATLLAAAGGSISGITRLFGPYLAPDAAELFANGDMSAGYTGWTNSTSGTGAVVSGELVATGGGTTGAQVVSPAVSVADGQAYQFGGKYRRGTAGSVNIGVAAGVGMSPLIDLTATNTTTSDVVAVSTFSAEGTSSYLALRIGGASPTGTVIGDDFTVKKVDPLPGWNALKQAVRVDFVTPASAATAKTLLSVESKPTSGGRSIWRLYLDTDLHMKVAVTARGSLRGTLDLGLVGGSEAHTVHMSYDGTCFAQLDNREMVAGVGSVVPMGAAVIRVARSGAGETWDGAVNKVSVFAKALAPPRLLWIGGDSYASGSPGIASGLIAAGRPAMRVTASGGTDIATQLGLLQAAAPTTSNATLIWWDGDANGASADPAADMAIYAQGIALLGHQRFIIIPSLRRANNSSNWAATTARRDAILAAYPNNSYDAQAFLATLSDGSGPDLAAVAAGYVPPSCLVDLTHLTAIAANAVMADVKTTVLDAKGW